MVEPSKAEPSPEEKGEPSVIFAADSVAPEPAKQPADTSDLEKTTRREPVTGAPPYRESPNTKHRHRAETRSSDSCVRCTVSMQGGEGVAGPCPGRPK